MNAENEYEPGRFDHADNPITSIDYSDMMEAAHDHNYPTFEELAKTATPEAASDLRFVTNVSSAMADMGGRARVVGGFARDAVQSRLTGVKLEADDVDLEVYKIPFAELKPRLEQFGRVEITGESFQVAKLINPETGNHVDVSIPRTDSKTGDGHRDFEVTGDPNLSVAEAARRRDLTINAMAYDPLSGELEDPFNGLQDLKDKKLRATDPETFPDDALRVLRVMRFAGQLGFDVDDDTAELCLGLDLSHLTADRLGGEWNKLLLRSKKPSVGLEVAKKLGVLEKLHPELEVLDQWQQEEDWHPEGNVWEHIKLTVDAAAKVVAEEGLTGDDALVVLYGALCHDLGKATTTKFEDGAWRAKGHAAAGEGPTRSFLKSLRMKNEVVDRVVPIVREHMFPLNASDTELSRRSLDRLTDRLGRANIRFLDLVSRCDTNGRGQLEWQAETPSSRVYAAAMAEGMGEQRVKNLVEGSDVMQTLGIERGPRVSGAVHWLREAQMDKKFATKEDGLAYALAHSEQMEEGIIEFMAQREAAHKESLERRREKQLEQMKKPREQRRAEGIEAEQRARANAERLARVQAKNKLERVEKQAERARKSPSPVVR